MRGPLRARPFCFVWAGESLSMIGDATYQIVFVWLVLSISGSPAVLAGVLVATSIPRAALLLLGGAVTDRVSARTVMLLAHLVRGGALMALTAVAVAGTLQIWELAAVGVLFGVADAFFAPASGSILPTLVLEEDLPRANSLVGVSEQVAAFVGPVLGGALLALHAPALALGANAATFLVAAITALAAPRAAPPAADEPDARALLAELSAGLAYAARSVDVRVVLILITAATLSYSGLFAIGLPALAKQMGDPLALGIMVAGWGLGQLVGAIAATATGLPHRWGVLIIAMTLVEGTAFAVLGFVPDVVLATALLGVLGVGVAYSTDVALPTFIQTRTPPALLGRVNSVISLPRFALEPISIAAMGALALLGVRWTFALAAVPMLTAGVLLASSRTARRLTLVQRDPDDR